MLRTLSLCRQRFRVGVTVAAGCVMVLMIWPVRVTAEDDTDGVRLKKYHEYERAISAAFRAEAGAKSVDERVGAIYEMTALFRELRQDPRLETSNVLRGYKARLWSRLTRIQRDLERAIERRERLARRGGTARQDDSLAYDERSEEATRAVSASLDMAAMSLGGPGPLFAFGQWTMSTTSTDTDARGGGGRFDYGPDLVALIQRTISPDFWDVHGGPGTIVYYRPLYALVVRATGGVHRDVGKLIGALRDE